MISNRPVEAYVAPHRFLEVRNGPLATLEAAVEVEALPLRPFTLAQHFQRGGFAGSLYADTDAASRQWRGSFLRDGLPLLPCDRNGRPIDPQRFWSALARFNGEPQNVLQRRLQLDTPTFQAAVRCASQRELVSSLPFWVPEGPPRSLLIYLSDSGLWHRLFEDMPENDRANPRRGDVLRNKAWEGFNVVALRGAAGSRAHASVWRRDQIGEIDLILDWGGSRWAIEISSSVHKRVAPGFWTGVEVTRADRRIVVRPSGESRIAATSVEYMNLAEALVAVSEGP